MGMFRDEAVLEIDLVKEMAESLGSTGLRLEELLEKAVAAREAADRLFEDYHAGLKGAGRIDTAAVNEAIKAYNAIVEKAEETLRWLLIQREACGFRTHKHVDRFYPIPRRMRLIKP